MNYWWKNWIYLQDNFDKRIDWLPIGYNRSAISLSYIFSSTIHKSCSSMYFITSLPMMVGFIELINGCIQFKFSGVVSFLDNAQVIGTYLGSSKEGLFAVCAPRCNNDLRCNAIDICFENLKCKLISGWTPPTAGNVSDGVCRQFQMVGI